MFIHSLKAAHGSTLRCTQHPTQANVSEAKGSANTPIRGQLGAVGVISAAAKTSVARLRPVATPCDRVVSQAK